MRARAPALLTAAALALSGCGGSTRSQSQSEPASTAPTYASEPYTHQQQLVAQGGHLVVVDGCSACHLLATARHLGPSFYKFAGHYVTLADGRRALVDERFLRASLLHPGDNPIKGYSSAPMIAAVKRLHLSGQPEQVAALAAFIEQIGPESEPEPEPKSKAESESEPKSETASEP